MVSTKQQAAFYADMARIGKQFGAVVTIDNNASRSVVTGVNYKPLYKEIVIRPGENPPGEVTPHNLLSFSKLSRAQRRAIKTLF